MPEKLQIRVRRGVVWAAAMAVAACLGGCASPKVDASKKEDKGCIFFPSPPSVPRIQFLCHLSSADDLRPAEPSRPGAFADFVIGKSDGKKKGYQRIGRAYGIAVRDGKLFVADISESCAVKPPTVFVLGVCYMRAFLVFGCCCDPAGSLC